MIVIYRSDSTDTMRDCTCMVIITVGGLE